MSQQISLGLTLSKQISATKVLDFALSKVVDVDSDHTIETVLEAGISDYQIDLFDSALIVETEYLLIQSDQPLTVRLGLIGNTPIEVEDFLFVTDSSVVIFVSVPGTDNATVKIFYGGKTV